MTKNQNTAAEAKTAAAKALRTCRCGCEAPLGGKAAYRPGHDARHISNLKHKLDLASAGGDRTLEAGARIQEEVFAIFAELKSIALRQKLGRAVDNDKEGLYNSFGDAGVFVPYSENPSLGGNGKDRWGRDMQVAFEAAHPAEAPKAKKTPKAKEVNEHGFTAADGEDAHLFLHVHEETPAVPEPMWTETEEGDKTEEAFEVKIGRWTYPAKHLLGMDVRNTKRDGSGEWVPYTAS